MNISLKSTKTFAAACFAALGLAVSGGASASTIFLLGTDAVSLHDDATYQKPILHQLQDGSALSILAVNNFGAAPGRYATIAGDSVTYISTATFNSMSLATLTANYSALFFASPGACCSDPGPTLAASQQAVINGFLASGGNMAIEDFQSNSYWNSILGTTGNGQGVTRSLTCIDPGISTASGIAFGFNASYSEGCFEHQTYDPTFWAGKGYFALQTAPGGDWITMASGFAEPGVPEPASLALLAIGLLGFRFGRRKAA